MENIIWKPIIVKGYENLYMASNDGQIKNAKTNKNLSLSIRNGYQSVCLYNGELNTKKTFNVHILVGNSFLENKKDGDIINHKNGIKTDNHITNLEYTTYKGNALHALKTGLYVPHTKKVKQYDMSNVFIAEFNSIIDAANQTNTSDRHISDVCKSKRKSAGGFKWKYSDDFIDNIMHNFDTVNAKQIDGYSNYRVDLNGNIFSNRSKKILIPRELPSGYMCVGLSNKDGKKDFYVHRIVALAYLEKDLNKTHVNHKNGIKNDNRLENLEFCNQSENMIHHNNLKIIQKVN